eukprot:357682-Chlamydomonas_euryale.AAC.4
MVARPRPTPPHPPQTHPVENPALAVRRQHAGNKRAVRDELQPCERKRGHADRLQPVQSHAHSMQAPVWICVGGGGCTKLMCRADASGGGGRGMSAAKQLSS